MKEAYNSRKASLQSIRILFLRMKMGQSSVCGATVICASNGAPSSLFHPMCPKAQPISSSFVLAFCNANRSAWSPSARKGGSTGKVGGPAGGLQVAQLLWGPLGVHGRTSGPIAASRTSDAPARCEPDPPCKAVKASNGGSWLLAV